MIEPEQKRIGLEQKRIELEQKRIELQVEQEKTRRMILDQEREYEKGMG